MPFSSSLVFNVTCDGPECSRKEETRFNGPDNVSARKIVFVIELKEKGWKRVQHKGVVDTTRSNENGTEYDYEIAKFSAWFCPSCVGSNEPQKWKDEMKEEYPPEEEYDV